MKALSYFAFLLVSLPILLLIIRIFGDIIDEWNRFKVDHKKTYACRQKEAYHLLTHLRNKRVVAHHNKEFQSGRSSFEMELNHLADLPKEEYSRLNGYKPDLSLRSNGSEFRVPVNAKVPDSLDWRDHGYVTEVKNQGNCGSCWAFSSTGALEGQHKRATDKLVSLSEQNLVDCSGDYGNDGCEGGVMDNAFEYVKNNHGIDTEKSYPYFGKDCTCHFNNHTVGAVNSGFVDIPSGDEEALKIAVATQGPISVAIDASRNSFWMYKKGVYYEPTCHSAPLLVNHGVLVVGYGACEKHGDYWIVKNSWGPAWGDNGYIKMVRNKENHCGIASVASFLSSEISSISIFIMD